MQSTLAALQASQPSSCRTVPELVAAVTARQHELASIAEQCDELCGMLEQLRLAVGMKLERQVGIVCVLAVAVHRLLVNHIVRTHVCVSVTYGPRITNTT
jgi:hypothetical protein